MKKSFFLSQLAIAAVIFSLVACSKNNTDPDPDPDPEHVTTIECPHTDLEYVEAVQRTASKMGNVAHYHCNGCNRNFLDASATQEVKNAYFRAKNYTISPALLDRIKHIYPFVSSSQQTKEGEEGLIPDPVSTLFRKVKLHKFKKVEKEFMKEVVQDLNEIQESLDAMSAQLSAIQLQNQEIINMLDGQEYQEQIDILLNEEVFIWKVSCQYFGYVKTKYENYAAGKYTQDQFVKELRKLAFAWNDKNVYNNINIYPLTKQLIGSFNSHTVKGKPMTFPQIFHEFNNDYRLWDHQGYTDRKQLDLQSEASLSIGYFMAGLYRDYVEWFPDDQVHHDDSLALYNNFVNINTLVEDDLRNMKKADESYFGFHDGTNKLYLCKKYVIANPDVVANKINGSYSTNLYVDRTGKSQNDQAIQSINQWLNEKYDTGWKDGTTFSADDLTMIINNYPNGDIFKILRDTVGIVGMPQYHETRDVEGTKRTIIMKYTSPKLNYFSSNQKKCSYHDRIKTMDVWYDECWFIVWGCGHEGTENATDIRFNEMNTSCNKGDYLKVLYNLKNNVATNVYDHATIHGQCSGWKPSDYAFVYLKKYTGTIWDK